jgi:hypothetical protein
MNTGVRICPWSVSIMPALARDDVFSNVKRNMGIMEWKGGKVERWKGGKVEKKRVLSASVYFS